MCKKPNYWPEKYIYTQESFGKNAPIELLRLALCAGGDSSVRMLCIEEKRVHPHLEIRKIDADLGYRGPSPHPLAGLKDAKGRAQYGLFATQAIPQGAALGEFAGEVAFLTYEEAERCGELVYNLIIPLLEGLWCVDSNTFANELMYANDYRGLQETPNATLVRMVHRGMVYFGYAALKNIEAEEEILIDYGPKWAKRLEREQPSTPPSGQNNPENR